MSPVPAILIFDIGKTTKKVLLFDYSFNVLDQRSESIPEIKDDDGFPAEDLSSVSRWVTDFFDFFTSLPDYAITHCNISAYGASLVHLDSAGKMLSPFYNYLKPLPSFVAGRFMKTYNADAMFPVDTASPVLGLLNSGVQLYWLKADRPLYFQRISTTLHLPQYLSYLLTGIPVAEITSIGCHTMLWDYKKEDYHDWVHAEGIDKLFPPIQPSTFTIERTVENRKIKIGIGVHDSSAALMPYLATRNEPFLLLSTGTWNICFNPFSTTPLTPAELASDCLCYLTYEGKPVKASRIFLGHEHEVQVRRLEEYFNATPNTYQSVRFDADVFARLEDDRDGRPFFPLDMEGTGPLPGKPEGTTDPGAFADINEAYHQLVRYLVKWQLLSVDLIDPHNNVKDVIVVGGFTQSPLFLEIFQRLCPGRRLLVSDHPRASALGAAWITCGKELYASYDHLLKVTPYV